LVPVFILVELHVQPYRVIVENFGNELNALIPKVGFDSRDSQLGITLSVSQQQGRREKKTWH